MKRAVIMFLETKHVVVPNAIKELMLNGQDARSLFFWRLNKRFIQMTDEMMYMHLCYYLLNKFNDNHIEIPFEEWEAIFADKNFIIKHRFHNNQLQVIALEDKNEQ
jgi:hypothetical protein